MESVLRWLIHEAGLPAPVLQHVVRDGDGAVPRRGGPGVAGPAACSWSSTATCTASGGSSSRTSGRQNGLVLAGWTVLRFTSADVLGRPQQVIAAIRTALGLVLSRFGASESYELVVISR